MSQQLIDRFHWFDFGEIDEQNGRALTDEEKYSRIVGWAGAARGQNPSAFDALTGWILDDAEWTDETLAENERFLMQGIFARFKTQNARLRVCLKELEPSGAVNAAVFKALDRFDDELSGKPDDKRLCETVAGVLSDFSAMRERAIREQIAGNKTGPTGTDSVELFGYVNYLKDCDAGVQWALFMPDMVKRQQDGFQVDSFEYKKMPAMRFIGIEDSNFHSETVKDYEAKKKTGLKTMTETLDAMSEHKSGFDYDVLFQHHYGRGVDVEGWHGFWGRFMKADTPVPEGFVHFDFIPQRDSDNFVSGPPYLSQFAFAVFSGDLEAMHNDEGTDGGRMYDITRNIMLGQGVNIPYPDKYWTAEVFLDGCDQYSTAYMFSAEL